MWMHARQLERENLAVEANSANALLKMKLGAREETLHQIVHNTQNIGTASRARRTVWKSHNNRA
jgi:hypothetical protein